MEQRHIKDQTVPDFGQAQITCGGVKLVFQGPNHPLPVWSKMKIIEQAKQR